MNINDIKNLRNQTGASIKHCKKCLEQAKGDLKLAIELLRRKGAEIAEKKSSRQTGEGIIGCYLHSNSKLASLVKLYCETDFVARNKEFQNLAKDLAMHITAMNPKYLTPEDVPEKIKDKEKAIEKEKLIKEKKPEKIIEKILQGKLNKFFQKVCLVKQPFVKDDKKTIETLIKEKIQRLGENIEIGEFIRMEL